jgi:hypothetical protein
VIALPQPNSLAGNRLQGVLVPAMKVSAATPLRSGTRRGTRRGASRRWRQQWLDALPQRIGQQSVHQGAHGREHPRTSLNPSSTDRLFRNVHLVMSERTGYLSQTRMGRPKPTGLTAGGGVIALTKSIDAAWS